MKLISFVVLLLLGITAVAQHHDTKFAVLKTDYREASFKVYYENGLFENLIDTEAEQIP